MKLRQIGQKLNDFKNYIGNKTYGGIKSLGNKIYDNRYKIAASAVTAGGVLLNNYLNKSTGNSSSDPSPNLYETLKKEEKISIPKLLPRKQVSGLFPPSD